MKGILFCFISITNNQKISPGFFNSLFHFFDTLLDSFSPGKCS